MTKHNSSINEFRINSSAYKKMSVIFISGIFLFFLAFALSILEIKHIKYEFSKLALGCLAFSVGIVSFSIFMRTFTSKLYNKQLDLVVLDMDPNFTAITDGYFDAGFMGFKQRKITGKYKKLTFILCYVFPKGEYDHTGGYQIDIKSTTPFSGIDRYKNIYQGYRMIRTLNDKTLSLRVLKSKAIITERFELGKILDELSDYSL